MAATKPAIPIGYARAAVHGQLGPASWVFVMYFKVTISGHTVADAILNIASYAGGFPRHGIGLAHFPTDFKVNYVGVAYRDDGGTLNRTRVADADAGTAGGDYQDAQVTYLVNWSSEDERRGGKARQYIAGVPNAAMADSANLTSAAQADINANLALWPGLLLAASTPLELVEMSFRDGKTWRDAAHPYTILGGTINPVVATQRRRVDRLRPV